MDAGVSRAGGHRRDRRHLDLVTDHGWGQSLDPTEEGPNLYWEVPTRAGPRWGDDVMTTQGPFADRSGRVVSGYRSPQPPRPPHLAVRLDDGVATIVVPLPDVRRVARHDDGPRFATGTPVQFTTDPFAGCVSTLEAQVSVFLFLVAGPDETQFLCGPDEVTLVKQVAPG
jgi:hypothetical protein